MVLTGLGTHLSLWVTVVLLGHSNPAECFAPRDVFAPSVAPRSNLLLSNAVDPALTSLDSHGSDSTERDTGSSFPSLGRRLFLGLGLASFSLTTAAMDPKARGLALAEEPLAASEILLRLRNIPTFCIVNSAGIPYMIFDGAASATGYFFLSFKVAADVLNDARTKDETAGGKWDEATIISIPLAVALQLGLRKVQRKAVNNGILFNTYNDIVASEEGVEDAQLIDRANPDRWVQKGRVPLFYVDGLEVDGGMSPRYFNKADLLAEWNRQYPNKDTPTIKLVEMVDLFRYALGKGGTLESIQRLKLVPVDETRKVAAELRKKEESIKYSFNEVFLVQSAKG
jgi:hypothetical protein